MTTVNTTSAVDQKAVIGVLVTQSGEPQNATATTDVSTADPVRVTVSSSHSSLPTATAGHADSALGRTSKRGEFHGAARQCE
jgi:hypothetical protein